MCAVMGILVHMNKKQIKEGNRRKWKYSYRTIGEQCGLTARQVKYRKKKGEFDPMDLLSVSVFIIRACSESMNIRRK